MEKIENKNIFYNIRNAQTGFKYYKIYAFIGNYFGNKLKVKDCFNIEATVEKLANINRTTSLPNLYFSPH